MMISFPIYLPWTFKSWKIATILCLAICATMYMGTSGFLVNNFFFYG